MISVVIPLYNEQENIEPLQNEVAAALSGHDYELILVDDCSSDDTLTRIDRRPGVRVIEFAKNTGQSAAMYAGIYAAKGEVIVLLDGDRQNDPADILKLLAEIEKGADLVCGYRANRKDTAFKRLQSRIANFVRSRFTGDGVRDTGCTLKAMRRDCREALVHSTGCTDSFRRWSRGWVTSWWKCRRNIGPRVAGVSKYGFGNRAWKATCDMFAVKWLLSRQVRIRIKGKPIGIYE
jgi:glycosyltransferase involved in cell wall biosynthesis